MSNSDVLLEMQQETQSPIGPSPMLKMAGNIVVEEEILKSQSHKPRWTVLDPVAYHGLAGEVVNLLAPHTEADPVALLASFLSEFGTMLNRSPHLLLDGSYHPLLVWFVLVGQSSKSRKGTADKRIRTICAQADPSWNRGEYKGTLSSGEGLVFAIRDPQFRDEPVKEKGVLTGETVKLCVDSGIEDKRLFLVQPEFGAVLRVMSREGNSLSGVLRDAWDGVDLAPMTKSNRVKATHPHVGIAGHVTTDELRQHLSDTEMSNGFGNRFMFLEVRRSQELPFSSTPSEAAQSTIVARVAQALQHGRATGLLQYTDAFREDWEDVYSDLSQGGLGLTGSLLARAEAQVMRLSGLYAILDQKAELDSVHLRAALALWECVEKSTALIFGDCTGNYIADTILRAMQSNGALSDTDISGLFGRNTSATKLLDAKMLLLNRHLVTFETIETEGRTKRIWKPRTNTNKTNLTK